VKRPVRLLAFVALAHTGGAQPGEVLQNWFNDPFFQISAGMPDCPRPAGPFVTERERLAQAHRRAEKGTTCWLAQACDRPNAYAYDPDIAAAFQQALKKRPAWVAGTTLWVTVQGRVVYIEGCARRANVAAQAEAFARALPHVQQASAIIRRDPPAPPPYRTNTERP
jgi:hypothetical protein